MSTITSLCSWLYQATIQVFSRTTSGAGNTVGLLEKPPLILVEIRTSSPWLDKSPNDSFTITLSAKVAHDRPITIDTFMTVLESPRSFALDYQGLTFQNIEDGTLAERRVIDALMAAPDRLTATSHGVVELPPRSASKAYTVAHTFTRRSQDPPDLSKAKIAFERDMIAAVTDLCDQTVGLVPGRSYTIGLADQMSSVSWWREGTKAEVFGRLGRSLSRHEKGEPLRMELVKAAQFRVVDANHTASWEAEGIEEKER